MPRSDRFLKGAGHLKIPVGLVMVTELDSQYGRICRTSASDEEKTAVGVLALAGATFSLRPIPFVPPRILPALLPLKPLFLGLTGMLNKKSGAEAPQCSLKNE